MNDPASRPGVPFPPPLPFVVAFGLGWLLQRWRPLALFGDAAITEGAGWTLLLLGLLLMFVGMGTFLRAGTAVIPFRAASRLVTWGPYRFTRNPMYAGFTIAYLGGVLLMNSVWPLLFLPLAIIVLSRLVIEREERHLLALFGEEYAAYRRQVRRWI